MSSRNSAQKRKIKKRLLHKGRKPCCFCQRTLTIHTATIEHVVPLAQGGGWEIENIKLSCSPCNQERGVQDFERFRDAKHKAMGATSHARS